MSYSVDNRSSIDEIDQWMREVPQASGRGSGDDVIKTLGVTVALDGATQFGAAYMNEPYLDVYGEPFTLIRRIGSRFISFFAKWSGGYTAMHR